MSNPCEDVLAGLDNQIANLELVRKIVKAAGEVIAVKRVEIRNPVPGVHGICVHWEHRTNVRMNVALLNGRAIDGGVGSDSTEFIYSGRSWRDGLAAAQAHIDG